MPLTPIKNSADRIKDKLTILTAELIVVDCKLAFSYQIASEDLEYSEY